jgi:hypothetical protein
MKATFSQLSHFLQVNMMGLEGDHDRFLPSLSYNYHVMLRNRYIDKCE